MSRYSQVLLLVIVVLSSSLIAGFNSARADPGSITPELPEAGAVFDPEDEVIIRGTVEGVTSGQVHVQVESDVTGKKILDRDVNLADDGSGNGLYEYKFALPKEGYTDDPNYEFDTFSVLVTYQDNEGNASFDVTLDQITLEFSLDKETYKPGEQVTITGSVSGSSDGDSVIIDITDPSDEKIVDGASATITDEEFTYQFNIPNDAQTGEPDGYQVDVNYKDTLSDFTTFTVEGTGSENSNIKTFVKSDSEEYDPGDQVTITGTVAGANDGDFVSVTALGPDDKPLPYIDKVNVGIVNNNFTHTFSLDNDAVGGTYEVTIKFGQETKSSTFRVKGLDSGTPTTGSPTLQLPVKVGRIHVETDGEKYEQGDQVLITGIVDGAYDKDEVDITVFGPDSKPLDEIDNRKRMISDERFSLSFDLSRESDLGIYKVLVKALGDEEDTLFIVEGDGGSTDDPFTVVTDQDQYLPGDRVEISGKVAGTEDGTDVIVSVYDPIGEVLNNVDTRKDAISDEKFTFSFDLGTTALPGRYKVFVDVAGDTEDTIFSVIGGDSGPASGVAISINDDSLAPGDAAVVTITAEGASEGDVVHYTTFGPDNNEISAFSGQAGVNETNNHYSFVISFTDGKPGGYAIQAEFNTRVSNTFFKLGGEDTGSSASTFVETDKLLYDAGEVVHISGAIDGAVDDDTVTIVVDDPENDEVPLLEDEVSITGESFSTDLTLEGSAPAGFTYYVHATHDSDSLNTFFAVSNVDNPTSLNVDDSYAAGSEVTITGTAEDASDGDIADVNVYDQNDDQLLSDSFPITDGQFEFTFNIDSDASGRGRVEVLAPACCSDEAVIRVFDIVNEGGGGSTDPTIDTDNTAYAAGEQVQISGSVPGAADDEEVKVSILGPDESPLLGADEEVATISSENFEFDFTLPDDAEDGLYRVKGEAPNGDTIFTFFGIGQDQNPIGGGDSFTVTTENTLYNLGDDVIITGTVAGATDGQKVRLTIKSPDEIPDDGSTKKSVSQSIEGEEYTYTLSISDRDDEGVYFVQAEFGSDKIYSYFDIEEKHFEIDMATDEMEYDPGDVVEISGSVKGAEDGDKVEITVTTPNGEVLKDVDQVKDKVVDEEFGIQFRLDEGGDIGVYMIEVDYEDEKSIEYGYFDVLGERNAQLIRVITDKNSYAPGDTVQIVGVAPIAKDGEDIDLTLYDPFNEPIAVAFHKKLDVTGQQFSFQYQLPNYAQEGVYEVHAIFFDHADFTKFQVIAPQQGDLNIGSLVQAPGNKIFFDGIAVDFQTNSELTSVKLDAQEKKVTLEVESVENTSGNLKIGIGKILRGGYTVFIDGDQVSDFTLTGDPTSDDATIGLNYTHSTHEIVIIGQQVVPEFPFMTLVPIVAFIAIIVILSRTNTRQRLFWR